MYLTYEEVDSLIRRIAFGKSLLMLNGEFLYINYPSNNIKIRAKYIRDASYNSAINDGLLPKKDLETLILTRGIFTEADEAIVAKIQSKIEAQEILLAKTLKVRANQDRIRNTIASLKEELSTVLIKKHSKLYMSADNKADEDMYGYMCSECVLKEDGSRYWTSYQDFIEYKDSSLKNQLFALFMELLKGLDEKTIRFIARSNLWRVRYTSSLKLSEPLFNIPLVDYTADQLSLIYWSNYYEQVYSMLSSDRPSDSIIDDDVLLDKFMEDYYKELNNETSIRRDQKNKKNNNLSAFDSEEVIITQFNELYQDIAYDKPREAQKIKDRADIKKRTLGG